MTPKLVVWYSIVKLQVLERKFFQLICANKIFKMLCGNIFKIDESRDILNFGDLRFRKLFFTIKLLLKREQ